MPQMTFDVTTPRGTMPVHLHTPDGEGPFPLVVVYMDSLGIRDTLHDHARRLAGEGYAVALPDLFYFVEPEALPDIARLKAGDPEEFARMGALVGRMDDDGVLADTAALLDALPDGQARPWGCVGFCMGGRYGLLAAERFGEAVRAASLLHPSRLVTDGDDSPHRHVAAVTAGLYLGFGEQDHVTPPSTIAPLEQELQAHGVAHTIEILAGADHGFTMQGMPAYNEAAAEDAWRGTLAVLGEWLPALSS